MNGVLRVYLCLKLWLDFEFLRPWGRSIGMQLSINFRAWFLCFGFYRD